MQVEKPSHDAPADLSPLPVSPMIPAASAGIQCDLSPDPVIDKSTKSELGSAQHDDKPTDSKPRPEPSPGQRNAGSV